MSCESLESAKASASIRLDRIRKKERGKQQKKNSPLASINREDADIVSESFSVY